MTDGELKLETSITELVPDNSNFETGSINLTAIAGKENTYHRNRKKKLDQKNNKKPGEEHKKEKSVTVLGYYMVKYLNG